MNAAVVFALVVGGLAVLLGDAAFRARRWLEVGISVGAMAECAVLAVGASMPAMPLWMLLLAVWVVVVLVGLAAWSVLRHVEKARTGEDSR